MKNLFKEMDTYPYRNRKPTKEESIRNDRIIMLVMFLAAVVWGIIVSN